MLVSSLSSPFVISYFYPLPVSASQIKYSSQVFLSFLCNYSFQECLSANFSQLCLPNPISYSYQLLVIGSGYYFLLYQLLLKTSHFNYCFQHCYQVTLSDAPISYSIQLFLSGTFISYL